MGYGHQGRITFDTLHPHSHKINEWVDLKDFRANQNSQNLDLHTLNRSHIPHCVMLGPGSYFRSFRAFYACVLNVKLIQLQKSLIFRLPSYSNASDFNPSSNLS